MLKKFSFLLILLALFASACGSDDDADTTTAGSDDTAEAADEPAEEAAEEAADAASTDSDDPIIIPIHNWTSQIVGAEVVGRILIQAGANVEYISSDSGAPVYEAMCQGDVSLVHEVWESSFGVPFEENVAKGCVIDAATHDTKTREEWWYNSAAAASCPTLPDWNALLEPDCIESLRTPETGDNARYLGGPVEWQKKDPERIEALNLPVTVVNAGSADAIWAELDSAEANGTPIMSFNWTPNFVDAVYLGGGFVEFPDFEADCVDDPSWGSNPDLPYDCGNPKGAYLKIGAWEGFEAKWPHAYEVLTSINFTNLDLATMAAQGDIDKMTVEDNAAKWIEDNADRVAEWVG